jgi:hypothetical protein
MDEETRRAIEELKARLRGLEAWVLENTTTREEVVERDPKDRG